MQRTLNKSSTACRPGVRAALAGLVLYLSLAATAVADSVIVRIGGIEGELLDNVRAALALADQEDDYSLTPATVERLYAGARESIERALQPFGFYRPRIEASLTPPAPPGGPWLAQFEVDPGNPLPIAQLTLALEGPGERDDALRALLAEVPLQRGDVLDHRHYEQAKQVLLRAAQKLGYRDAAYSTHRVTVDPTDYSASVTLTLSSGPRYVFGPVTLEQYTFSPQYLERYLLIEPGMPFDRELLSRQRVALSNSGLFREVGVDVGEPAAGGEASEPALPVNIRLRPVKANRFRGRTGWGTETGFGLQIDWTRRYIGSRGHRFNMGATAVEERERLATDMRYWIPLGARPGNDLELILRHESKDLNFRDVELDEGGETRIEANLVSARWNLPQTRFGNFDVKLSAGLNLTGESYDVFQVLFGNLPDDAQGFIAQIIGDEALDTLAPDFRALIPELHLSLRHADSALYIRRGDALDVHLMGAHEDFGSNISFWQARLSHWSIRSLGEHNRFLLRTEVGYSEAESREVLGATFNQMPELYEFRGGGARNVRGYGFETLFPENGITGGRHQLLASLEYEREIVADWSAAVFLDAGNVFNKWDDFEEKLGAGFGVRWRSPLGPARLDIGFPLDDADSAFQIYISVGPEF